MRLGTALRYERVIRSSPNEIAIMLCPLGVSATDVQCDARNAIDGAEPISEWSDVTTTFFEESFQRVEERRLSAAIFPVQEQVRPILEFQIERFVESTKSLKSDPRDLHTCPSITRTVSSVCSLSSAIRT